MSWLLLVQILIIMLVFGIVAVFVDGVHAYNKDASFRNRVEAFGKTLQNIGNDISQKNAETTAKAMRELVDTLKNKEK